MLLFFSKIFPITPGGWGISENIGALFLSIFYPDLFTEILLIFIIDHIFRSVYLFVYGGYSVLHYNVNLKKSKELVKFNKYGKIGISLSQLNTTWKKCSFW